jgi:hypothetical protein
MLDLNEPAKQYCDVWTFLATLATSNFEMQGARRTMTQADGSGRRCRLAADAGHSAALDGGVSELPLFGRDQSLGAIQVRYPRRARRSVARC